MRINKVLNNNVVTSLNSEQKEIVVMGRGLAFQKKSGDVIDEEKIEKVFTLENKDISERFKTLLYEVPMEYMEVSEEIINYARTSLSKNLNESIYVSLTDHIHFAIERKNKGLDIKNALLWEIKRIYQDEFSIGLEAVKMIDEKLGVSLPEDEAGFIAMHIVNAELNEAMPNIVSMTNVIQDILNIVKYHYKIEINEESLNYFRFVTHLKFFAQRLFNQTYMESSDDFLFEMVKNKHPEAYECTQKISKYIHKEFNYDLTSDEKLYLTIHIDRVVNRN